MATIRQKNALTKIVENGGNISKAMEEAGYSKNTSKTPKKLTNSKGFQQLMDEVGITNNFLLNALFEDIEAKKGNRKAELELAFKLKGVLDKENKLNPQQPTVALVEFVGDNNFEAINRNM